MESMAERWRPLSEEAANDGARRAESFAETRAAGAKPVVSTEVVAKPQRRRFTAEYKLRIVREAERCKGPGEVGALLRREGLYSSHLTTWRRQVAKGAKAALGQRRGRKSRPVDPRLKQLEKENARLRRKLEQATLMLELQKKASELLGIPLRSLDDEKD